MRQQLLHFNVKVYLLELLERVSAIHIGLRFLICNAYNNKKVGAICRSHITFGVQTSTFDSFDSQYLEIFGFIRIYFICLSNVVF